MRIHGKWGFIDTNGKFVIPPQFDQAWSFHDGYAGVKLGDKWGHAKIPRRNRHASKPKDEN